MWEIIDRMTGLRVGKSYKNKLRAANRADKLDNEYGGYRYFVRQVKENHL